MASDSYPEIVFDVSLALKDVIGLIKKASADSSLLRIVSKDLDTRWTITWFDDKGKREVSCELYVMFQGEHSNLCFSAKTALDSDRLAESVAICISIIFQGSKVLGPNLQPLADLAGPSEARAERIASFLRGRDEKTIEEISRSLSMLQYTVAVNLQTLVEKGIVGCTPPQINPRRFFYK